MPVEQHKFSFEKDILEKKVNALSFYALASDGYFIDIGIPSDYQKAQSELKEVSYFRT
jgi:D-glycero-alpha-D-manno-heptose 1-phosphate guanylyltransferase